MKQRPLWERLPRTEPAESEFQSKGFAVKMCLYLAVDGLKFQAEVYPDEVLRDMVTEQGKFKRGVLFLHQLLVADFPEL